MPPRGLQSTFKNRRKAPDHLLPIITQGFNPGRPCASEGFNPGRPCASEYFGPERPLGDPGRPCTDSRTAPLQAQPQRAWAYYHQLLLPKQRHYPQQNDRTHSSRNQLPKQGSSTNSQHTKHPSAQQATNQTYNQIQQQTLSAAFHNKTTQITGSQTNQ